MAGPFQTPWSSPKPPLLPSGPVAEVSCGDIDALDASLAFLTDETLALSDGNGPDADGDLTWMLPKVIPLTRTGLTPYVALDLEFRLLGHTRGRRWITLLIEGRCGTWGELRLGFPSFAPGPKGWQLHTVTQRTAAPQNPAHENPPSPPELANEPEDADAEGSAKQKRDDIFRRMFG